MKTFNKYVIGIFLLLFISASAYAAEPFVVKAIEFQGLQRVSRSTAIDYLPIKTGQVFTSSQSTAIIRSLFETGFFQDVNLVRSGNTLIIKVVERPTIGSVKVTGNKEIAKDKLEPVLKELGLVEGGIYDAAVLDRVRNGLKSEYYNRGRYNAIVTTSVSPLSRNRVAVSVDISEGRTAQISQIQIIGNHAFSSKTLINELSITTPRLWSYFTHSDQYSKQKLDQSLEALRTYYLDRGYIKFKIDSTQASLTQDKNKVYVVIHITEGPCYTIKGYKLVGNLIIPEEKIKELTHIKPGMVFSRKVISDAGQNIGKALGNIGYAFANVNAKPDIDESTRQIFITFYIDPGSRVYVRRITFMGNTKTADVVLRRALRQFEGSLVSVEDIEESKRRLDLLGYLEKTDVQTVPVPGVPDEVDLNYHVTEAASAKAIAGAGYGTDGFVVNASFDQNNFLGTGKVLSVNFNDSQINTNYSVSYTNPYYTPEGISRGFSVYVQRSTPSRLRNIVANYTTDVYGASVNYGIPVTANDVLFLGAGLQQTELSIGTMPSTQLLQFVAQNGYHFNQLLLTSGWSRNGLDRANFPTRGLNQNVGFQLSTPIINKPLDYYKISYSGHYYHPLGHDFIFSVLGNLGYGNGYGKTSVLPFFQNYFAGGTGYAGAVRGFEPNSLGPRDSNNQPLGGNFMATGSLALIVPNPYMEKLRTSAFMDAGNVYTTQSSLSSQGPMRYSVGLAADWRVPILNFMIGFSIAEPLNRQPGDKVEQFQFNIGTNI